MIAVLEWLVSPLWGTVSHVEAIWLPLTLGCLLYLRGHLCDARAQVRVAQNPVERRVAVADLWDVIREILIQACFGLIGLYAALTPSAPVDPARALGTLGVTGLLMAVQVTNLVFAGYRREARQWITAELRREKRSAPQSPMPGGRRWYDPGADPPSHERPPLRKGPK